MLGFFSQIEALGMRPSVETWNVILEYCATYSRGGGQVSFGNRQPAVRDARNPASLAPFAARRPCMHKHKCK